MVGGWCFQHRRLHTNKHTNTQTHTHTHTHTSPTSKGGVVRRSVAGQIGLVSSLLPSCCLLRQTNAPTNHASRRRNCDDNRPPTERPTERSTERPTERPTDRWTDGPLIIRTVKGQSSRAGCKAAGRRCKTKARRRRCPAMVWVLLWLFAAAAKKDRRGRSTDRHRAALVCLLHTTHALSLIHI